MHLKFINDYLLNTITTLLDKKNIKFKIKLTEHNFSFLRTILTSTWSIINNIFGN